MKQNGTSSNIQSTDMVEVEEIGNDHVYSSIETPMRKDAFAMEDDLKMELIEKHFRHIMEIMGLDLTDDSLKGTPKRVAKMFITEVFSGLDPKNKPAVTLFENKYKYDQMLVEKDISVFSNCEHHFVPIYGKAHVAYISSGKVIGLSKLNRIVEYFAKRPQVQERLTVQIANELKLALETEDVAVVIDAQHMCVQSRGIRDSGSSTVTAFYGGKFQEEVTKKEFLSYLGM
ncbi:GTP cyclohydrolase I FolE [Dyadobacter fanqingshengii]|uniref:GTP cyclohydrolase 1 n=1 Tax=Dyadobacter fanqingshengii TaxID=2906443 RepID=A0A9X1P9C3_9BACT|nr:GTP cyclohydrolase I FolE [Dyadobacter fanqingshengii]MCF0040751.1 GTP cyclohydrolase I FolE [Dyadobacter fanqingshengii]MCF2506141.1 GTP cyclohydrolase I FolE [Dyadobacter fanqingshengii]USJ37513.1 GTP cyclohydrolase I FolE [Dyadobacter fanqingshengii]